MLGYFLDVCFILGSLQSFIKYLRLALALCEIAHYGKNLISVSRVFCKNSVWKEDWALGCHSIKFWDFPDFS